jgi:hypothetical protein
VNEPAPPRAATKKPAKPTTAGKAGGRRAAEKRDPRGQTADMGSPLDDAAEKALNRPVAVADPALDPSSVDSVAPPPAVKGGKRDKSAEKRSAAKRVKPKRTAGKKDSVAKPEAAKPSSKRVGAKPAEVKQAPARQDTPQPPAANDAAAVENSAPKTGAKSTAGRASSRKKSSGRRGIQLKSLGKPTGDGLN